ncbi:TIGR04255 family protein [Methylococcus geothermalis]|uniref:TIGR04255 family protein n=1 Tax=Methylococcus geothermalis TaxID=2681310 RepID=A0A858Q8F3_9GAMM|nr:TIGR04255 family protein [Methylococcus geothermalis]QJD30107.1 TIGR04255 family protein [Methylococcus geothermalis]
MNQIPTRLKKEPLIEAIWQAQFEPKEGLPVGDLLPGILYSALKVDHPNLQLHRLPTADIPAPVAQLDPNLRLSAKYRMEEPGSPFLFQVGDRIVTMNCRKPYAGWSAFKEKILKLLEVIESSGLVPTPMRHSLRYIDLLSLDPAPDLKALQVKFQIGQWNIENRPLQMRVEVPDGEYIHVIQIATPAEANLPEGRLQGSIIDLETFLSSQPSGWQDVRAQIDQIHDRSKAVFFQQLLTAKAIELMQPEY